MRSLPLGNKVLVTQLVLLYVPYVDLRITSFQTSLFSCWQLSVCCFVFLFVFEEMMNCRYEGLLGISITVP